MGVGVINIDYAVYSSGLVDVTCRVTCAVWLNCFFFSFCMSFASLFCLGHSPPTPRDVVPTVSRRESFYTRIFVVAVM